MVDLNDIRIAVTLISLLLFVGLVAHTWSRRRKAEHAQAANLIFAGEDGAASGPAAQGERRE